MPFAKPSEEVLDDLKAVGGLSDDILDKLCNQLSKTQGFLNPKALLTIINRVIEKPTTAKAVQRIIINISPSDLPNMVAILKEEVGEEGFPFDSKQLENLEKVLKKLIQTYPSLDRFQKAERLSKITGQQLETIELICDLRPIFDKTRKKIEGMMPYTRLHIVATGEDGLPNAFEVELTHQQVIEFAEKAEKAKSKLEALHQSIESWLPGGLPDLPLTRILNKGSNDD
jgi:hypothetical protein